MRHHGKEWRLRYEWQPVHRAERHVVANRWLWLRTRKIAFLVLLLPLLVMLYSVSPKAPLQRHSASTLTSYTRTHRADEVWPTPAPGEDSTGEGITLITSVPASGAWRHAGRLSDVFQEAISSWLRFASRIVLIADRADFCHDIATSLPKHVLCVTHRCSGARGIPIVPCLVATGLANTNTEVIMYTNFDIAFSGLVRELIQAARQQMGSFAVFGRRYDRNLSPGASDNEELHAAWGLDYFICRKQDFPVQSMPPFVIGNWRWDNWLADYFIRHPQIADIDATAVIRALHLSGAPHVPAAERDGAVYNEGLVPRVDSGDFRDLGRSDNSNWIAYAYPTAFVFCHRRPDPVTLAQFCRVTRRDRDSELRQYLGDLRVTA
jgi:hypothetical protein